MNFLQRILLKSEDKKDTTTKKYKEKGGGVSVHPSGLVSGHVI